MKIEVPQVEILPRFVLSGNVAVIVVDMLNDFVDEKGSLCVPKAAKTVLPIKKLLRKANNWNLPIFFVNDAHGSSDPEFNIWPQHCVEGTWGATIIDPLQQFGGTIINKLRYDPFYGTSLEHQLRLHDVKTVVIVGTVTNICVLAAAHSAALRWFNVVVPLDCISALDDFGHHAALYQINRLYQGKLVNSENDLIRTWQIEKSHGGFFAIKNEWGSARYLDNNGTVITTTHFFPTYEAALAVIPREE